ncbi:MAG: response regulator [Campylobacterota bacterium]|nr:response regulator [Campylobacterota bacterium]
MSSELEQIITKTSRLHLLYVEDSESVRESTLEILKEYFDNIVVANDGLDGFEKFKNNDFDIVITDIIMPNLNGLDMSRKIREVNKSIPVIMLTAFSESKYLLESIKIGIDGYLNKPLLLEEFNSLMQRVLIKFDEHYFKSYQEELMIETIDKNVIMSKTDLKGIITYVSDAFCEISGYTKDELIGQPQNMVRHPDMPSEIFDYIWSIIPQGDKWEGELKNLRKDGEYYWVYAIITPDYNHNGDHIGYTSIRRDIADQKKVEILNASLEMKIEEANKSLSDTLKHTRDSIEYAALIQSSLIPDNALFRKYFQEYFVIWHPKDTVGGDIYLFNELRDDNECLIFCIDCTGHGVPGAFVTMLVKAVEAQLMVHIFNNPDMVISTAWVMGFFNNTLKKLLKQEDASGISNVGWDGSVFYYNKKEKLIKFSGAESPFFYRKPDGEIVTVKGTRKSVGYKQCPMDYKYKETLIENVEEGTKVFLTTDGYLDQNGGAKDFPFGKKKFIQIIDDYGEESMADLQEMFMYEMAEWEEQIENNDRNDDMTVIGFTI